ncbi:PrgI family protein [Saccharopolyspora sp. SCSIO 74807]|uniref:PrgI family protein n=1 Tax=Saccharopolyspora sp. SCSIO 74807 TaxID=3118084 RepID=UPI0030CCF7B3
MSVRIPADVDREDRILAGFTARQVAVMAVTGLVLYGGWHATRAVVPVIAYVAVAIPVGVAVTALVVVRRDGVALDRLLLAAVRQRLQPRRRVAAGQPVAEVPEWLAQVSHGHDDVAAGEFDLPAQGVGEAGLVDLGDDGVAVVAACSTVNFALRTPAEQDALTAAFGRWLHSLGAGVQILVRAQRLDLSGQIGELRERAAGLPHPALEAAALDHAEYLAQLGEQADLLRRQILLVVRDPVRAAGQDSLIRSRRGARSRNEAQPSDTARKAAAARLVRRMSEATDLLAPAGIAVTPLDAAQATAVLATATNPDSPLPPWAGMAGADEVITNPAGPDPGLDTEEDFA